MLSKKQKILFVVDNPDPKYVASLFHICFTTLYRFIDPKATHIDSDLVSRVYKNDIDTYTRIYNSIYTVPHTDITEGKIKQEDYVACVAFGGKSKNALKISGVNYMKEYKSEVLKDIPCLYLYSAYDLSYAYTLKSNSDNQLLLRQVTSKMFEFILKAQGHILVSTETQVEWIFTEEDAIKMKKTLSNADLIGYDFETKPIKEGLEKKADIKVHSVNFFLSSPTVLSISYQPGHAFLIPINHYESPTNIKGSDSLHIHKGEQSIYVNDKPLSNYNGEPIVSPKFIADAFKNNKNFLDSNSYPKDSTYFELFIYPHLKEIFEDDSKQYLAHNAKFDYKILRNMGIKVAGTLHDTMMVIHTINENVSKGLNFSCLIFVGKLF